MATSATHHEVGRISRRVLMRRMGLAALTFWLPARWSLGLASDADPEPSAETLRACDRLAADLGQQRPGQA